MKKETMKSSTFRKLAGLLGLSLKEIAEGTGYKESTVKAVSGGHRLVPPAMEKWLLEKLREYRNDDAVCLVLSVCGGDFRPPEDSTAPSEEPEEPRSPQ